MATQRICEKLFFYQLVSQSSKIWQLKIASVVPQSQVQEVSFLTTHNEAKQESLKFYKTGISSETTVCLIFPTLVARS